MSRPGTQTHRGRAWRLVLMAAAVVAALPCLAPADDGPMPLPADAPKLGRDVVVMTLGSSITMNRYGCAELPAWTGGYDRVPPQANGQNVFFRVFEMLNDHENMRWRRLTDEDWTRHGDWKGDTKVAWGGACYGKRISYAATQPDDWAELKIPAGYEKVDLIYTTDPAGDMMKVTIDGQAPPADAAVDTFQDPTVPEETRLGPEFDTLDSHGEPMKVRRPSKGISHLYELRSHYRIDPKSSHVLRVARGTDRPGRRVLVWGAVYWRGNCVQVVQRAKGGLNCGALPDYTVIQEVTAMKPDYVLLEAINIRDTPAGVTASLDPGYAWCARNSNKLHFKVLVYSTCQASSRSFRKWFGEHKPPYGSKDPAKTAGDENADACAAAVRTLCEKYGFPMVDVGPAADRWLANTPSARFVPHVLNDWYHPNQWGAALYGRTIHDGIRRHWPELPIRPIRMPAPPG